MFCQCNDNFTGCCCRPGPINTFPNPCPYCKSRLWLWPCSACRRWLSQHCLSYQGQSRPGTQFAPKNHWGECMQMVSRGSTLSGFRRKSCLTICFGLDLSHFTLFEHRFHCDTFLDIIVVHTGQRKWKFSKKIFWPLLLGAQTKKYSINSEAIFVTNLWH